MTVRRITIDNSLKYVHSVNSSESEYSSKDPKPKNASVPQKKNKKLSEMIKSLPKSMTGAGFRVFK